MNGCPSPILKLIMTSLRLHNIPIQEQALNWMRLHYNDYNNMTNLAEHCAIHLNHDEWLDDETHWIWDVAYQVEKENNE